MNSQPLHKPLNNQVTPTFRSGEKAPMPKTTSSISPASPYKGNGCNTSTPSPNLLPFSPSSPPPLSSPHIPDLSPLPPISRWTRLGGMIIASGLSLAAILSGVTPYKTTIRTQGIVRPVGELKQIEAETAGTITHLYARENQTVKAGDEIARLDDRSLQAKKSQLQNQIQQIQQQQQQLDAQLKALESKILAETDRRDRSVSSAEANLHLTRRAYRDLQLTSLTAVEEAQANLRSAEASLEAAQVRLGRFQGVAAAGALSQEQLSEAQLDVDQQIQAVAVARSQLDRARVVLDPSGAEVEIATERIAQETAASAATLATLRQEQQALRQQRTQLQQPQTQAEFDLQQVDWQLAQMTIRAPVDGTLFQLNLRNAGQTLAAGDTIGQIVPSQTELVIKTQVPVQEINRLQVGQTVQVRLSACPYTDYGTLPGQVSQVSPDITATGQTMSTGNPLPNPAVSTGTYEITIQPDIHSLGQAVQQCSLQMGMEGQVNIQVQEETILKFLLRKAKLLTDI